MNNIMMLLCVVLLYGCSSIEPIKTTEVLIPLGNCQKIARPIKPILELKTINDTDSEEMVIEKYYNSIIQMLILVKDYEITLDYYETICTNAKVD